jgi:hypothetical protein
MAWSGRRENAVTPRVIIPVLLVSLNHKSRKHHELGLNCRSLLFCEGLSCEGRIAQVVQGDNGIVVELWKKLNILRNWGIERNSP